MYRKRVLGVSVVAGLAAYLVVAGAAWNRYIVVRHIDITQLAALITPSSPPGFAQKPSDAHVVTTASSPFSAYRSAAKSSPSSTASYSVSWSSPKDGSDSVTILVSYLPSVAAASKVEEQALSQFVASGRLRSQGYVLAAPVTVRGVPGARGAVYRPTTSPTPPEAAVAFSTGRAQVLELLQMTGAPSSAAAAAAALAGTEYTHLRRILPGFELRTSAAPIGASAVYWAVVAVIVGLGVAVPMILRRAGRLRAEARRRSARRQRQVRGGKIARRQAARRR
jgi:hypothetical protein